MKEVLLKDFELMRSEIQKAVSYHWQYSIGFLPSILGVVSAVVLTLKNEDFAWISIALFLLSAYLVLAQMSAVFNYHYGYVMNVAYYIKTIEEKMKLLFHDIDLIEYERNFVPVYFKEVFPKSFFKKEPQPFFELLMLFPSILLFFISIFAILIYPKFYEYLSAPEITSKLFGYFIIFSIILSIMCFVKSLYSYFIRLDDVEKELDAIKNKSIAKFSKELKRHKEI